MEVLTVIFTAVGILLLLGLCGISVHLEGKLPQGEYDEYQIAQQHKGYRFAFWVSLFGQTGAVAAILLHCKGGQPDMGILSVIGVSAIMLPILAYVTYCALKNVMFSRWENPLGGGICFLIMGIAQFVSAFEDRHIVGVRLHCLVLGVGMLYISALYFWRLHRDRS